MDLAELGSFRLVVPSKMMDSAAEVTVKDALKTPKIVFTPKQKMRDAARSIGGHTHDLHRHGAESHGGNHPGTRATVYG